MRPVRICFTKTGDAKFISHLDLSHTMILALRRARIPVWYTEGYNPRPHVAFALPLPVGTESLCERMDIRVEDDYSDNAVTAALSKQLPDSLRIISAAPPVKKTAEIAYARYELDFDSVYYSDIEKLLLQPEIFTEKPLSKKRRKKGGPESETVEIKSGMRDIELHRNTSRLCVTLPAGTTNIAPKLISGAISEQTGSDFLFTRILRINIFDGELNEFF